MFRSQADNVLVNVWYSYYPIQMNCGFKRETHSHKLSITDIWNFFSFSTFTKHSNEKCYRVIFQLICSKFILLSNFAFFLWRWKKLHNVTNFKTFFLPRVRCLSEPSKHFSVTNVSRISFRDFFSFVNFIPREYFEITNTTTGEKVTHGISGEEKRREKMSQKLTFGVDKLSDKVPRN